MCDVFVSCDEGFLGQRCECEQQSDADSMSTCWHPVDLTMARWFAVDTASVSVASVCVVAITVGNSANVMTVVVNTTMAFSVMVSPVD